MNFIAQIHAKNTESFLNGKQLLDVNNVKEACKILHSEIQPDSNPLEAAPEFRHSLAVNLLYKVILACNNIYISTFRFKYITCLLNISWMHGILVYTEHIKKCCVPPVPKWRPCIAKAYF